MGHDAGWFYLEGGRRVGPLMREQLALLLRAKLPAGTLVWREGLPGWTQSFDLPELRSDSAREPPASVPPIPDEAPLLRPAATEPPSLNLVHVFRRCLDFQGRSSRAEFAVAYFAILGIAVAIPIVAGLVTTGMGLRHRGPLQEATIMLTLAWSIVGLVLASGAGVRRLHDLGQAGWLVILGFLPCLHPLMVLLLLLLPTKPQAAARPPEA